MDHLEKIHNNQGRNQHHLLELRIDCLLVMNPLPSNVQISLLGLKALSLTG